MQIQLKQTEIVEALKQYIAKQGFNLFNKSVDIAFTAGRKDAGLIADIAIEDIQLPELQGELELEEAQRPALSVVVTPVAPIAPEASAPEASTTVVAEEAPAQTVKSSLFG